MKLSGIKTGKSKIPRGKSLYKKITAALISIAVFLISFFVINRASLAAKNTVSVLRVKAADGIPERAAITKDNLVKYDIIEKEYSKDMYGADAIDEVINKFATHYLRDGSILHKDEVVDEIPLKNEWLYNMAFDEEVLTIPYNYLDSGGDILTPGDRIRVRVIYEENAAPGEAPSNDTYYSPFSSDDRAKITRTEILFESIEVKDMLNGGSHSIYEVYREVLRLPENQRQKVLKSSEFIKSIIPKSLVLSASSDQIDKYIQYKNATGNKSLLVTILARQENTIILDQLPTLQKEIEMWLEKQ